MARGMLCASRWVDDDSCAKGLEKFSVVQALRGQGDEGVRRAEA